MAVPAPVIQVIRERLGLALEASTAQPAGGGCINEACRISDAGGQPYFIKLNRADSLDMFEAERDGLAELARAQAVRVPLAHLAAVAGDHAFLLLEYLELRGPDAKAGARLGEELAALHRHRAERFGWLRDNTIGSTPQPNAWSEDWLQFFARRRLGYQLELVAADGHAGALAGRGERLLERLPGFFDGYAPLPSLLHGDLWGGNWAALPSGEPVLFDPAVYYGDREADIAMTRRFGGFPPAFYAAYEQAWPLDPGFRVREDLYNLYHVLNHLHLFGGHYLSQATGLMDRLLAQVRG